MIATAAEAGVNVFEYFTALQENRVKVKANPEKFLPWNYLDNI
jgi:transposase